MHVYHNHNKKGRHYPINTELLYLRKDSSYALGKKQNRRPLHVLLRPFCPRAAAPPPALPLFTRIWISKILEEVHVLFFQEAGLDQAYSSRASFIASMASIPGVDVGETLAIEETRKKLKKKSKRGVYRPKIQIDLVFKRSTAQAPAKTEKATLKKYTRKNKVGKRVEDVGDGGEDDLILGGENNSMVVGVGGGKIEGVEVSCMEGVFLAGESYVPFPEIGGEVAVKKVEEDREEMGIVDCTPPPAPWALERKFQKTYQRRRGLNVKRCLDFGSGLKGIELEHACESLEKFEFPVGKFRGEMIVGEGGKEQEAMVASNFNHVAFTRKPRTKRARKAGLVKPFSAHPREWSFLLSRENLKTVLTKSGRCNGKSRRDDLLLVNVLRKKRTLRGKRREMSKILGELGFAEKKKSRAICCRVSINDHLSALVPRKQRTFKSKERATNEEPSEEIKMKMPNFEIESSNNFHFPMSNLAEQIGRPLVVPNLLEGAVSLSGLAKESNGPLVEKAKKNGSNSVEYSSHVQSFAQAIDQHLLLPSTSLQPKPQNAIVPYRKRPRRKNPEILMNEVSRIMWRLTETEETSEMDAETEERCTEEHKLFNGLVQKFLAIMRLVQGDKSYSKWNGSVLDSIVGAYLTQNVTDTLSSHVFMCLASRFPPRHATNGFNVRGNNEFECEDMHTQEANENGAELFYPEVCSNAYGNLKKRTEEVCGRIHGSTEKLQESSIQESEGLEQKATSPSMPKVPEGQTSINQQDDKECETDNFKKKDEFSNGKDGRKLTDMAKAKATKGKSVNHKKNEETDWDSLRREACCNYFSHQRIVETLDSIDYEALRNASVEEVASIIKKRGMNNRIAARIQNSLNRFVEMHGTMNLEWLRLTPEDKTKDYLLHIMGMGLKSVECIRLLSLQQHAFPVDTNVARICVRLGWVPLQPLPQNIQIHVLDQYPDVNKIQQYLWPRLRRLDPQTLYELHYQMITFGKVFCTKSRPNCKACPLKEDCRHYASACASERLALPSPEEKQNSPQESHRALVNTMLLGASYAEDSSRPPVHEPPKFYVTYPDEDEDELIEDSSQYVGEEANALCLQDQEASNGPFVGDIEDFPWRLEIFPQKAIADLKDINMSNALVPLSPKAVSTPMPKLKQLGRLRTEHLVYELPDDHPLLAKLEPRVAHDSCPYLLNIWLAGETADSIQTSMAPCNNIRESGGFCNEVACFDCNNAREGKSQSVKGTLLIPCRTAMRGYFPLNGTYFQMNEVFADDATSWQPIEVSRNLIWNLRTAKLFCGSHVMATTRGFSFEQVCEAFCGGYFCFRGFDRSTRLPKPLSPRLHCRVNRSKIYQAKEVLRE